jgi:hypothetical protein
MVEISMCNIDEIMDMLDWNNSEETQRKGIELAKNIKSINAFVLPMNPGKSVWENCAIILANKPDEILNPYLFRLLEWIEDINWPGALIVLDRLKNFFETEKLSFCVQESVRQAKATNNKIWLGSISKLLDNTALSKVLPDECLIIMHKHYHNKA